MNFQWRAKRDALIQNEQQREYNINNIGYCNTQTQTKWNSLLFADKTFCHINSDEFFKIKSNTLLKSSPQLIYAYMLFYIHNKSHTVWIMIDNNFNLIQKIQLKRKKMFHFWVWIIFYEKFLPFLYFVLLL